METVVVADLLANSIIGRTIHLDEYKVEVFAERFEELPPPVAFRTPDGLLLADGYHRVAAARALGRASVECDVRVGSRRDALVFAARVGAEQTGMDEADVLRRIMGIGSG